MCTYTETRDGGEGEARRNRTQAEDEGRDESRKVDEEEKEEEETKEHENEKVGAGNTVPFFPLPPYSLWPDGRLADQPAGGRGGVHSACAISSGSSWRRWRWWRRWL